MTGRLQGIRDDETEQHPGADPSVDGRGQDRSLKLRFPICGPIGAEAEAEVRGSGPKCASITRTNLRDPRSFLVKHSLY